MRDKIKDRGYIEGRYKFNFECYNENFIKIKEKFSKYLKEGIPYSKIEDAMSGRYYWIFTSGFESFYAGYSLGLDIKEIKHLGEGLLYGLYKNNKWTNLTFEATRAALLFIIVLNIKTEYVEKFIKLIRKDNFKDRYIDHLINYIDKREEIKATKLLFNKKEKMPMKVVDLANEGKKEEAVKVLKEYVTKQWINLLDDQTVIKKNSHLKDYYVGYWCIEAAALVKMYDLDDEILKGCDYYPYELAHFED